MMMFRAVSVLALASVALASPQLYGPPAPPPAAPSSSASAASAAVSSGAQILVQVGQTGFTFSPSDIQAPVGTLVTFVFPTSTQHAVTQSSFSDPCTPLAGGFDSGFVVNGDTYSINVTDASNPIYFFCKFPAHCGLGMIGTINAPSSGNGSNSAFSSAALAIGSNEAAVSFTGFTTGGVGAVATAGPSDGTPSVSGAPAPTMSAGGSSSGAASLGVTSTVSILGVVAAMFAVVL